MCSVLEFSSESDKLRTLFSESNHFDSVLFIFDGGVVIKFRLPALVSIPLRTYFSL